MRETPIFPLELKKRTLLIQQKIASTPTKGLPTKWNDKKSIKIMQQKALDKKLPIIYFLDPSKFDRDALLKAFKELVHVFVKQKVNEEGLKKLLNHLESGKVSLSNLIEATLREDINSINKVTQESGVKPELLLYLTGATIQPCIEEIARKIDSTFSDKWWQGSCPICGRIPAVAKNRYRKRFLVCTY